MQQPSPRHALLMQLLLSIGANDYLMAGWFGQARLTFALGCIEGSRQRLKHAVRRCQLKLAVACGLAIVTVAQLVSSPQGLAGALATAVLVACVLSVAREAVQRARALAALKTLSPVSRQCLNRMESMASREAVARAYLDELASHAAVPLRVDLTLMEQMVRSAQAARRPASGPAFAQA